MTGCKRLIMLSLPQDGKGKRFSTLCKDVGNLARAEGRDNPYWESVEHDLIQLIASNRVTVKLLEGDINGRFTYRRSTPK